MWTILYFISVMISYYVIRYYLKKNNDWDWSSFGLTILFSLGSILTWVGIGVIFFADWLDRKGGPPKWL